MMKPFGLPHRPAGNSPSATSFALTSGTCKATTVQEASCATVSVGVFGGVPLSRWPRTIRIRRDASVTTAEPAIAVARDQVIDRVADHPWDEVEDPCPLPARKLAR